MLLYLQTILLDSQAATSMSFAVAKCIFSVAICVLPSTRAVAHHLLRLFLCNILAPHWCSSASLMQRVSPARSSAAQLLLSR